MSRRGCQGHTSDVARCLCHQPLTFYAFIQHEYQARSPLACVFALWSTYCRCSDAARPRRHSSLPISQPRRTSGVGRFGYSPRSLPGMDVAKRQVNGAQPVAMAGRHTHHWLVWPDPLLAVRPSCIQESCIRRRPTDLLFDFLFAELFIELARLIGEMKQ